MFKPRELKLLRALHELGSVTAAASRVHLSQPAASAMIRAIEARLGFDLYLRERRRLIPTANCRALLPELLGAAAALDATERLATDLRRGWSRRLTVGTVAVLGLDLLPSSIAAVMARHDGLSVAIRTGTTDGIATLAAEQRIDCGLIIGDALDDRLAARRLGALHLCAVLHPEHPLADRRRMSLSRAVASPYIALARELPVGAALARELESAGLPYAPAVEATQTAAACALVRHNRGVAIVESIGADLARRTGLVVRRLVPVPSLTLNLVWSRSRGLGEPAMQLADELATRVAEALQ